MQTLNQYCRVFCVAPGMVSTQYDRRKLLRTLNTQHFTVTSAVPSTQ